MGHPLLLTASFLVLLFFWQRTGQLRLPYPYFEVVGYPDSLHPFINSIIKVATISILLTCFTASSTYHHLRRTQLKNREAREFQKILQTNPLRTLTTTPSQTLALHTAFPPSALATLKKQLTDHQKQLTAAQSQVKWFAIAASINTLIIILLTYKQRNP